MKLWQLMCVVALLVGMGGSGCDVAFDEPLGEEEEADFEEAPGGLLVGKGDGLTQLEKGANEAVKEAQEEVEEFIESAPEADYCLAWLKISHRSHSDYEVKSSMTYEVPAGTWKGGQPVFMGHIPPKYKGKDLAEHWLDIPYGSFSTSHEYPAPSKNDIIQLMKEKKTGLGLPIGVELWAEREDGRQVVGVTGHTFFSGGSVDLRLYGLTDSLSDYPKGYSDYVHMHSITEPASGKWFGAGKTTKHSCTFDLAAPISTSLIYRPVTGVALRADASGLNLRTQMTVYFE